MADARGPQLNRSSPGLRDSELPSIAQTAPVAPETRKGRRIALSVLLVVAFLCVAWIASPLWVGIVLGTTMAFTTQPTFRRLVVRFGEHRRRMAAAVVTITSGVITAFLGAFAIYVITRELLLLVNLLQDKLASGSLPELIGPRATRLLEHAGLPRQELVHRLQSQVGALSERAAAMAAIVLQATTSAVLGLLIALMTQYYVLLEWPTITTRLERLLPLDPRHTRALVLEFRDVGRSAFVGTVATAIIQGLLAWIGYAIGGVGQAMTWGLLTAIASFLPLVGTTLVWVPIAGYQVLHGHVTSGLFVFFWGLIIVSIASDYVIRPRVVGQRGQTHPLLMLVALLGGIEVMGLAGLLVAPILMSLFLAILRIYERETEPIAPSMPAAH